MPARRTFEPRDVRELVLRINRMMRAGRLDMTDAIVLAALEPPPAAVHAIATVTLLDTHTVRRHLTRLAARGLVDNSTGGWRHTAPGEAARALFYRVLADRALPPEAYGAFVDSRKARRK